MSLSPGKSRPPAPATRGLLVHVRGRVQGVGFRPFVKRLADREGLAGKVRNFPGGVEIELEGTAEALQAFVTRLRTEPPPLAQIDSLESRSAETHGLRGFSISPSEPGPSATLPPPDAAMCDACRKEISDPPDRRHRYPFTTCVDCGPRYTILRSLPYDRPETTMADFTMCAECLAEYQDASGRRLHAQTNACAACGPRLRWLRPAEAVSVLEGSGRPPLDGAAGRGPGVGGRGPRAAAGTEGPIGEAALEQAVRSLRAGEVVAIKGLGGFHLACDATSETAVTELRERKGRDRKPFALMARSVAEVRNYAHVSSFEERLLESPARPIVLVERSAHAIASPRGVPVLADGVAPGAADLGFFLPYSPLHHLLLEAFGAPLVLTSGNLSDEPIAYEDGDAIRRLGGVADGFVLHDRAIERPADDSVLRAFRDRPYPIRRSRGYVPDPVPFRGAALPLLAVGAHQKNTFCLTRGTRAFLSVHHGDLEHPEALQAFERSIEGLTRLLGVEPRLIAHDLHPDYGSTRLAQGLAERLGLPLLGVQHHEAHVASVLAEREHAEKVVGIAYDGTGYGADGTVWGGELFVGDASNLVRRAHWEQFPLPGGDLAARQPWRSALGLLLKLAGDLQEDDAWLEKRLASLPGAESWEKQPWRSLIRPARAGLASPLTSSVGRLFDGVAALVGLPLEVSFEAEGAILLESLARAHYRDGLPSPAASPPWPGPLPAVTGSDRPLVIPLAPLLEGVLADLESGLAPVAVAGRFHHQLAWTTAAMASLLAEQEQADTVALGGGVFQNPMLLELTVRSLEVRALRVLVHRRVPTNDGGLSLGQAEIAAARGA